MTARIFAIARPDHKAALARLLRNTEAGILFNEHLAEDGPVVFAHACRLVPKASFPSESTAPDPVDVRSGSRSAIPPASPQRERSEIWNRQVVRAPLV
jgi:hypothetical protein